MGRREGSDFLISDIQVWEPWFRTLFRKVKFPNLSSSTNVCSLTANVFVKKEVFTRLHNNVINHYPKHPLALSSVNIIDLIAFPYHQI